MTNSTSELETLFIQEGELLELPVNHRILMHDEKRVLWVEEGDLDIYVLAPDSAETEVPSAFKIVPSEFLRGSFTFLLNVPKGKCMFPFPSNQGKVIGLANGPVKLRALSRERLNEFLLEDQQSKQKFLKKMGWWVNNLPSVFKKYRLHLFDYHLKAKEPTILREGETVAIPRFRYQEDHDIITWIAISRGRVSVLGLQSISLNAGELIYPMSPSEWLKAEVNDTHIDMFTEEYDRNNYAKFWQGLLAFHHIVVEVVMHDLSELSRKEQAGTTLKKEKEGEFLDKTLREMAALLSSEKTLAQASSRQPLIHACQLVGNVIQRTFVEPLTSKAATVFERIYEIAVASGVHYRQVLLTSKWWESDNGPLVGLLAGKQVKPVALLKPVPGEYQLIDPEAGTVQRVNTSLAEEVSSKAYMFYRAFPNKIKLLAKDILHFCMHDRLRDYWIIFLIGFFSIVAGLFLPIANQLIFDEVIPFLDTVSFFHIFIGLVIMFASIFLFSITREYTVLRAESYLSHDVEVALWERVLTLPAKFFRNFTIGNLILRISSVQQMRRIISGEVIRVIIGTTFSFVYLLAMLYYSPILTLVGLSIVFLGLIISLGGFLYSQKLELANQEIKGQINGKVVQMIFGLSKIRTNGAENRIFASWAKDTLQSQRLRLRIGSASNLVRTTNNTLELLKYLIIFMIIMYLMQSESTTEQAFAITIGSYLAFNAAYVSFSTGIAEFSNTIMEMIGVYPLWQRSQVILHEPPETGTGRVKPDVLKGEVRIDQLSFRYDPLSPPIFTNLNLKVYPGEFIAIVGPSGCGKSTLLRLLVGFEIPEQGAIYYDGKDLANLDLRAVRTQLGTILQNSMIVDGTIYDNIVTGNLASEEQVLNAANMAGLHNDLKDLPMGLRTLLTTGGTTLSGGQRQRVLLARSFLSKASIMLWDEATNALDNQSQDEIMRNLEKLDITRIVIAHRLSTIRHADRIYVMDQGKFIDSGTYKELSSRPGMFADMLSRQV